MPTRHFNPSLFLKLSLPNPSLFSLIKTELESKMGAFNLEENDYSEYCFEEFSNFMTNEVSKYLSYNILYRHIRNTLSLSPDEKINVSEVCVLPEFYSIMKTHDFNILKILHPDFHEKTINKELSWIEMDYYPRLLSEHLTNFNDISLNFSNTLFVSGTNLIDATPNQLI